MAKQVIRGINVSMCTYEKKRDTENVCASIMRMHFRQAEKMKLCRSTMVDLTKTAAFVSMNNMMIYLFKLAQEAEKQGLTMSEFLGEMQIELQDTWNCLSKTKAGLGCFGNLEIEDVINNESPFDLFKKGSILKVQQVDRIEKESKEEIEEKAVEPGLEKV